MGKNRMVELQKENGKVQEEQLQDVEEQYISDYSSDEDTPVPQTVTDWQEVTEKVPVSKTVMKEIEEDCTAWTFPLLNIPIPGTRKSTIPVSEVEWQEVTKSVPVQSTTTKWIKKRVKRQRVGTRTVTKTTTVEVEVPLENFRAAAKAMILEENEKKVKDLIDNAKGLQGLDD